MRQKLKHYSFLVLLLTVGLLVGCVGGELNRTYGLTVTVLGESTTAPVVGANVEVVGGSIQAKQTNELGKVSFGQLKGTVELLIELEGFVTKTETVVVNREQSITVYLKLNPSDPVKQEVDGPRFATVSKRDGRYFNFETGESMSVADGADLELTWLQVGNEYTMIGFTNINGVRVGVSKEIARQNLDESMEHFRTLLASDWQPSQASEVIRLAAYDTLILKTSTNRLVKLFVLEMRGHWQHDDAAAVDFAYIFLDEVDNSPPVIESVTLVTATEEEITMPLQEGVIEFSITGDPELIRFTFNEVVYSNRPLARRNDAFINQNNVHFSPAYRYQGSPYFDQSFTALISVYGMSTWNQLELSAGDEAFYADFEEDQGYFFSDLLGNQLVELPFEKIVIKRLGISKK